MTGDQFRHDDAAYVLGVLEPAERLAFERHLEGCSQCQSAVREFAGLPGLLARIGPDDLDKLDESLIETEPKAATDEDFSAPLPNQLLPKLMLQVARERRRRRWTVGAVAGLAAACAAALVITLAVARTAEVPVGTTVTMQQVQAGPVNASLQLVDKTWGTAIVINCAYGPGAETGPGYEFVLIDTSGRQEKLSSWGTVPGRSSVINAATELHADDISGFEIRSAGTVILRGTK